MKNKIIKHTRARANARVTKQEQEVSRKFCGNGKNKKRATKCVASVGGRFGSCFGTNICSRYFYLENATLKFF